MTPSGRLELGWSWSQRSVAHALNRSSGLQRLGSSKIASNYREVLWRELMPLYWGRGS
jgi:hypothetical protein